MGETGLKVSYSIAECDHARLEPTRPPSATWGASGDLSSDAILSCHVDDQAPLKQTRERAWSGPRG